MKSWLQTLDRILRGEMTPGSNLEKGLAEIPLGGMTILIVVLGAVFGMGVGSFALFKEGGPSIEQFLAAMLKLPAFFLLTLLITFLYCMSSTRSSARGCFCCECWSSCRLLLNKEAV